MRNGSDDETVDHHNFFHRYAVSADRDFFSGNTTKDYQRGGSGGFPIAGAAVYRAHHFIEASSNSTRFADALYRSEEYSIGKKLWLPLD